MQIGDAYTWTPTAFEGNKSAQEYSQQVRQRAGRVTGRVVYIHPKRRYFTVEAILAAGVIRESFKTVSYTHLRAHET